MHSTTIFQRTITARLIPYYTRKKYDSQIAIEGDWLFEKYTEGGKTFFSFPHNANGDKTNVASALNTLAAEAARFGHDFVIRNMTEDEKELVLKHFSGAEIKEEPGLSDYIYLAENSRLFPEKSLAGREITSISSAENTLISGTSL